MYNSTAGDVKRKIEDKERGEIFFKIITTQYLFSRIKHISHFMFG